MGLIEEVKKKKEYSKLPDSIVKTALSISKNDVKETRAFLRKYFGVFLTNKVLKGKVSSREILLAHKSSQKREYAEFYRRIKEVIGPISSITDLGAGANGYSYDYIIREFNEIEYTAVEAVGQIVNNMNDYFNERKNIKAKAIQADLLDIERIKGLLHEEKKPRAVFLLQVIDALEGLENNYSKKFLIEISKECEYIIMSLPTETLGSRKKFSVNRKWLTDFIKDNFFIMKDYELFAERVIIIRAKK